MRLELLSIFLSIIHISSAFIVGGCIGPKSAFERYLTLPLKKDLKRLVHERFDGSNQAQVLSDIYHFVHSQVTPSQWAEIYPEIERYRQQNHECSVYAQLLPPHLYKQLLMSVWRASETGADKFEVKRLVEEYIEKVMKSGEIEKSVTQGPPLKPAVPADPIVRRVTPSSARVVTPPPVHTTLPPVLPRVGLPPSIASQSVVAPRVVPPSYLTLGGAVPLKPSVPIHPHVQSTIRQPLSVKNLGHQARSISASPELPQQFPSQNYYSQNQQQQVHSSASASYSSILRPQPVLQANKPSGKSLKPTQIAQPSQSNHAPASHAAQSRPSNPNNVQASSYMSPGNNPYYISTQPAPVIYSYSHCAESVSCYDSASSASYPSAQYYVKTAVSSQPSASTNDNSYANYANLQSIWGNGDYNKMDDSPSFPLVNLRNSRRRLPTTRNMYVYPPPYNQIIGRVTVGEVLGVPGFNKA